MEEIEKTRGEGGEREGEKETDGEIRETIHIKLEVITRCMP